MIEILTHLGILLLTGSILLAFLRMSRGPTVVDRILAFDAITVCVVGMIVLLTISWKTPYFLELILVVSLLGFLSGVAFVFYFDKTLDKNHQDPLPRPPEDSPPTGGDS